MTDRVGGRREMICSAKRHPLQFYRSVRCRKENQYIDLAKPKSGAIGLFINGFGIDECIIGNHGKMERNSKVRKEVQNDEKNS